MQLWFHGYCISCLYRSEQDAHNMLWNSLKDMNKIGCLTYMKLTKKNYSDNVEKEIELESNSSDMCDSVMSAFNSMSLVWSALRIKKVVPHSKRKISQFCSPKIISFYPVSYSCQWQCTITNYI